MSVERCPPPPTFCFTQRAMVTPRSSELLPPPPPRPEEESAHCIALHCKCALLCGYEELRGWVKRKELSLIDEMLQLCIFITVPILLWRMLLKMSNHKQSILLSAYAQKCHWKQ